MDSPLNTTIGTNTEKQEDLLNFYNNMQQFNFAQVTKAAMRRQLGILPHSNVYMCFQGLFKIHPMFDKVIFDILSLDRAAVIVFMHDEKKPTWTDILNSRLTSAAQALSKLDAEKGARVLTALSNGRVHFRPKLPHTEYLKFVLTADVHLDPFPFGGGLTTAELLGLGLPVVTLAGSHRSGRLTTAMYSTMGVSDLVTRDVKNYASLAVRVCNDETFRDDVVRKISTSKHVLFSEASHQRTVTEWSHFLTTAVDQVRRATPLLVHPTLSSSSVTMNLIQQQLMSFQRPLTSLIDFSSSSIICDMEQLQHVNIVRLVPTLDIAHQVNCSVHYQLYNPESSLHPAADSIYDVAVSLSGITFHNNVQQVAVAQQLSYLTHLFSSSKFGVVVMLEGTLRHNLEIMSNSFNNITSDDQHQIKGVLVMIHRLFPQWKLRKAIPFVKEVGEEHTLCIFEKDDKTGGYITPRYGSEPELYIHAKDLFCQSQNDNFVVHRQANQWDLSAAVNACHTHFPEYINGIVTQSHFASSSLPLSPSSCAARVYQSLTNIEMSSNSKKSSKEANPVVKAKEAFSDGCTMIVPVYKRLDTLISFLQYYQSLTWLHSIIVVWNNIDVTPPSSQAFVEKGVNVNIKIIRQTKNSLNNRYLVSRNQIHTKCVLAVDDDDIFDLQDLNMIYEAWKLVPERVVGLSLYQRTHLWNPKLGQYIYSLIMGDDMPASMLLNSGTVYSSKLHDFYAADAVQNARLVVDSMMNGEDILFNFVTVNATGNPPLILKHSKPRNSVNGSVENDESLSSRSQHFSDRSSVFNTFAKYFNDNLSNNSWKIDTVPPYAAVWNAATGMNGNSINALVLPRYTRVVEQGKLSAASNGYISVDDMLEGKDSNVDVVLYEFMTEGSMLHLSNGQRYATVMDHKTVNSHLQRIDLGDVTTGSKLNHWVAVHHTKI
jgi:hypothetical protein